MLHFQARTVSRNPDKFFKIPPKWFAFFFEKQPFPPELPKPTKENLSLAEGRMRKLLFPRDPKRLISDLAEGRGRDLCDSAAMKGVIAGRSK